MIPRFKTTITATTICLLAFTYTCLGQVEASITVAPPVIPIYVQPACPIDGWIWSPGYWAWGPDGYYWVPGVWVAPPQVGFLWTPGYWSFVGGVYAWNAGYWGPTVGFYGGVCYGFGYGGEGYYGGRWAGGHFQYNTAVTHVNTSVIHHTYVNNAVVNNTSSRASFNGPGGVTRQPTANEQAAMKERHIRATSAQKSNEVAASKDKTALYSKNKGKPATAAKSSVAAKPKTIAHKSPTQSKAHSSNPRPNNNHTVHSTRQASPQRQHSRPAAHRQTTTPTHTASAPHHHVTHQTHTTPQHIQQRPAPQPHMQPTPRPIAPPAVHMSAGGGSGEEHHR